MKLEHKYCDTYNKTFLYMIYKPFVSHNYHREKSTVPVYITTSIYYCNLEHETDF
jgi:hypothetical protein